MHSPVESMHRLEYNVMVIGSGNSGFSAALSAEKTEPKKVLISR